jgi:predicted nucleic acid-binding protein
VRLLLDSSFVIDHLRGLPEARQRWERIFEDGDETFVNEIVVCEVRTGLRAEDERHLLAFLEPAEFVQPDQNAAIPAGRWRAEARQHGWTVSLADALIAAAADANGSAVLTRNIRDFSLLPVRVEAY